MAPRPPSLVRDYLKTEPRRLMIAGVVVLVVAVIATTGYVLVVGWDKWSNDMAAANHMMLAGYAPAATTSCPRLAAYTSQAPAAGPVAPTAPPGLGRQFFCTSCGTSALPIWSAAGQPVCPVCGSPMAVATPRPGLELAAAP